VASGEPRRSPDLRSASLIGANLSGAILTRTNLIRAWLIGADLNSAYLNEANLSGADLGLEQLLAAIVENVIAPAEEKVKALQERRRMIEAELTKPR
jgi:uncharacterized protein YjbI with pentapeptide repeats